MKVWVHVERETLDRAVVALKAHAVGKHDRAREGRTEADADDQAAEELKSAVQYRDRPQP